MKSSLPGGTAIIRIVIMCTIVTTTQSQSSQNLGCPPEKQMQIFCYIALWYPQSYPGRFTANDVDPFLCTHFVLSYFQSTPDYIFQVAPERDSLADEIIGRGRAKRSTQYLLSVGGYNDFNYDKYSVMGTDPSRRQIFVNNVVSLLKLHKAQGVDFMWNFIGRRNHEDVGDKAGDLRDLAVITKALCGRMKMEGFICLITLVKAEKLRPDDSYRQTIATIIKEADFVNIWTADIAPFSNGPSSSALTPQDLLIPLENASYYEEYKEKSINFIVDFYKEATKNREELLKKISMVVTLQTRTHGLKRDSQVTISANTVINNDANLPLPGDDQRRFQYPYFEVCEKLLMDKSTGWEMREFPGGIPIAIDYSENKNSEYVPAVPTVTEAYLKKKVAFARSNNLGGISVFHITADDILGFCKNQTYPILNAINDELHGCRFL